MIADNPHCCLISIHTPLAGSDRQPADHAVGRHISIRTPLAGSDGYGSSQSSPERNFNPHSPCGERPSGEWITWASSHYFNPHSPCGERRGLAEMLEVLDISIHTPLAGSDVDMLDINDIHVISIHTPLAGSDRKTLKTSANSWNFNPHSPCGERPATVTLFFPDTLFQSTLPLRGATRASHIRFLHLPISIHTPLAGSDQTPKAKRHDHQDFNPHSPCGERPGR